MKNFEVAIFIASAEEVHESHTHHFAWILGASAL